MAGWSLPLCHTCVCDVDEEVYRNGSRNRPIASQGFESPLEIRVPDFAPKVRGYQTFSSAPDQPLLGVPIREGCLWHLSAQDRFEPITFSLYVNGFSFSTADGTAEASVSLSPFSLVRNCRFQSGECSKLKSFKVSLLEPDPCCYFAVRSGCEREAEEERSDWVLGLSHTILLITDSLLPTFSVTCDPLPGVPATARRLMAGYLIHRDNASLISVIFCELHAHSGVSARMVLYENELCESSILDILITESSSCCDVVGINCSCFVVDCHYFASQTPSERKLWLRALSNVKVKIQNRAPEPSDEELQHYRTSIREHISALEATLEPRIVTDALLAKSSRKGLCFGEPSAPKRVEPSTGAGTEGDVDNPTAPATNQDMEPGKKNSAGTHVSL